MCKNKIINRDMCKNKILTEICVTLHKNICKNRILHTDICKNITQKYVYRCVIYKLSCVSASYQIHFRRFRQGKVISSKYTRQCVFWNLCNIRVFGNLHVPLHITDKGFCIIRILTLKYKFKYLFLRVYT